MYGGKCNCHLTNPEGGCLSGPDCTEFPGLMEYDRFIKENSGNNQLNIEKPISFAYPTAAPTEIKAEEMKSQPNEEIKPAELKD